MSISRAHESIANAAAAHNEADLGVTVVDQLNRSPQFRARARFLAALAISTITAVAVAGPLARQVLDASSPQASFSAEPVVTGFPEDLLSSRQGEAGAP